MRKANYVWMLGGLFILTFGFSSVALNCPDGSPMITKTVVSGPTVSATLVGSKWEYTASGTIRGTLNCDPPACVTQGSMGIAVYSGSTQIDSGSGLFNFTEPMCEEGDSVEAMARLSGSSPYAYEPDRAEFQ